MKSFIAILAFVAVATADAQTRDGEAVIVNQDADVLPDQYQFSFKTSNDIQAQESGVLVNVGKENESIQVQGSNSYVGTDGQVYSVTYIADEGGYQPQGAHLPVPPAVPEYILRSLAYIAANPPKPEPGQRA
ncbi:cuticle protein CP14.6-like [Pararge aegeria]|uniref:cuticle protein CP14.6-like n=1 Tax=Pararge aegeria TaxID=116150 RepID=UPI0019CF4ECF|nr:cuticle protein CP14.6-like [Pararge aegeria]